MTLRARLHQADARLRTAGIHLEYERELLCHTRLAGSAPLSRLPTLEFYDHDADKRAYFAWLSHHRRIDR